MKTEMPVYERYFAALIIILTVFFWLVYHVPNLDY
jgi:hypothetical protein